MTRNLILSLVLFATPLTYAACSSEGEGDGDGRVTALSLDGDTALPAAGGAAIATELGIRFGAVTANILSSLGNGAAASSGVVPKASLPICPGGGSADLDGALVEGTDVTLTVEDCAGSPLSATPVTGRIVIRITSVDTTGNIIDGRASFEGSGPVSAFTIFGDPDTTLTGSFVVAANIAPTAPILNLTLGSKQTTDSITLSEGERTLELGCFDLSTRLGLTTGAIEYLTPIGVLSLDGQVYTLNTYIGLAPQIRFDLSSGTAVPNAGSLLIASGDKRLDESGSSAPCFGAGLAGDDSTAVAAFMPAGVVLVNAVSPQGICFGCSTTWENLLNTLSEIIDSCSPVTCEGGIPICTPVGSGPCEPGFGENCCDYPDTFCNAEGICTLI